MDHRGQSVGRITLSAGVAVFPDHAADATALLQVADAALSAAKQGGRDRVALCEARAPS